MFDHCGGLGRDSATTNIADAGRERSHYLRIQLSQCKGPLPYRWCLDTRKQGFSGLSRVLCERRVARNQAVVCTTGRARFGTFWDVLAESWEMRKHLYYRDFRRF